MDNLISFGGICAILACAWALSESRRTVNWKLMGWGLGLQMILAVGIFVTDQGRAFFLMLNSVVIAALGSATAGIRFLFGPLALPPGAEGSPGFILAFQALPTIVFFASLMAVLYQVGILPWIVGLFSRAFTRLMNISGAESLCAASNIFVGVESAMSVRPHLEGMTRSELHTVLAVGMGTIASSVLALYVMILGPTFPSIAGHLISASILSAPATLMVSKLLVPETGKPATLGLHVTPHYEKRSGAIEAAIHGANEGVRLVVGISALLIAFLGFVALADALLGQAGEGLSLSVILGYVAWPFTVAIGVPLDDATEVARLIGQRAVVTEVKSYQDLAALMSTGGLHHARSAVMAAYALCGFAHVASLAIFVGGIAALVPSRMRDLASLGPKALLAATLGCLITAAVAGGFFTEGAGMGILLSGGG